MARHMVKCKYCGVMFDANEEPYVKVTERRYAHKACVDKQDALKTQDEKDLEELEKYIKELLHLDSISPRIRKQIHTYHINNSYSYSGMRKALYWFYEVEGNSIEKANGGIGIIPYVYDNAYKYFLNIYIAQMQNEEKNINDYKPQEKRIKIPSPRAYVKPKKLFNMGDEEREAK